MYGIFKNAITNGALSTEFIKKYFYCLWWGLQNLSSYGQTLTTSTFVGETLFAILIAILGLVLFAHLIGNMQFFNTPPYACEPSSLPKYPPSKEMDAKLRDEEARSFWNMLLSWNCFSMGGQCTAKTPS
ncbi:cyclic nucleotide-gated ion channel 17-like isoform X1 [Curcuma longa]|uniref:cyclic nucleotide-gated ion channel 17-like isoform X1 n=1 Tax=Curcuma longa TaxID=136217 RepID=UPI003D9E2812